jgi:hypothetical protein
MFSEISVTIKDDEKRLTKKFLQYEVFTVSEDEPIITQCINETLENFDGTPDSIKVCIIMEIK